ncbi:MAG: biotin/lipoyl-binding protein, partial [Armatimonadota bacterium]|nr:biotin/lipoyl-binding protein [Armatimonadota bacterium]
MRRVRIAVVLVGLVGAAVAYVVWPRARPDPTRLEASGTIEVAHVDVAPKVAGRVAALHVREGDQVAAGQVVAELEREELEAQVRQAEASLAAARARLRLAEAGVALARAQTEASVAQARAAEQGARTRVPQAAEAAALQGEAVAAQVGQARAQVTAAG